MGSGKGFLLLRVSVLSMAVGCSADRGVAPRRDDPQVLVPPDDSEFVPLTCGADVATDPLGDTNGGATGRDVVGDLAAPAILRAGGPGVVYLRMRLDSTPQQSEGNLASFGWGYEFDSDSDVTSYEKVFIANGVGSDQMDWWDNTVQGSPDDPADPPEVLLETYAPSVDFWAVTPAASNFGGDPDWFLTIAVQQSDLQTYGVSFACVTQIWAGSSNSGQRIDNDLACHDGAAAPYSLSAAWIGQPPDPEGNLDFDGDGLTTAQEILAGSDACDPDSDDDGLGDGLDGFNDSDGDGLADAIDPDSDNDGLTDGLEAGVAIPLPGTDVTSPNFHADGDPSTVTDPDDADTDDDGLVDGAEDANADGILGPTESDPADFDTDDGGVGDGTEVGRGTRVRDPRDDFHVAGSGGCAISTARSGSLLPLLVLACVALAVRRRALLAVLVLAPVAAHAQSPTDRDFDLQRFRPAPGFHDVIGISSPRAIGNLRWTVGTWANHASQPLRLIDPSDGSTERAIIADQTAVDVTASIGFFERYELGFALPMTIARAGGDATIGPPGARNEPGYSGLADLRIMPKALLFERNDLAFGIVAPITLPTSSKDDFMGMRAPTLSARALGEWRSPRLRVIANAGVVAREEQRFVNLRVGTAATFGAAVNVPVRLKKEDLVLFAAVDGETALRSARTAEAPIEASAGAAWRTFDGFAFTVGGARGLTNGYGTPTWRAFAGVSFAPSLRRSRPAALPVGIGLTSGRLALSQKIDFGVDDDLIQEQSFGILGEVATFLKKNRWIRRVRIEGHTDNQGDAHYNLNLSQLRAISIARFLVTNGVEPDVLESKGYGLTQPIATNDTEEGRSKNRRVEFVVLEIDEKIAPEWAKAAFSKKPK